MAGVKNVCPRQDSNLRPFAPEANALSPELRGRTGEAGVPVGLYERLAHVRRESKSPLGQRLRTLLGEHLLHQRRLAGLRFDHGLGQVDHRR